MTSRLQRRLALLGCIALVVLSTPGVAAEDGELAITAARYTGGSTQQGDLTALFVANVPAARDGLDPPTQPEPASPLLELQGKRVQAVTVTRQSYALPEAGGAQQPVTDPTQDAAAVWFDLEQVQAATTDHQLVFQIHVLAQEQPLAYQGRSEAGNYQPLEAIYLNSGRFGEEAVVGSDYATHDPESEFFWDAHFPGPFVGHDAEAGVVDMTLRGNFVLELFGITLEARHGNDAVTLASGIFETPVAPGIPVQRHATVLVRLFVEDGLLRVATQGGLPAIAWGGPSLAAVQDGPTTLEGARGDLQSGDALVRLDGESYLLPAGNLLGLAPAPGGLAVAVQPAEWAPSSRAASPLASALSETTLAVVAFVSLAIAVTLGALRRWSAGPATLPSIERALADGAYARAARLARRLLRAEPHNEDARLARAIALSRAGSPKRVIRELTRQLDQHDPSDGSLHYVLGLAQLDAGRSADGERTLAEAVRRTPALARDVKARLDPGSLAPGSAESSEAAAPEARMTASAPSAPREAHGYA